jgi:hypothetical protein
LFFDEHGAADGRKRILLIRPADFVDFHACQNKFSNREVNEGTGRMILAP